jgi:cytochrome P460
VDVPRAPARRSPPAFTGLWIVAGVAAGLLLGRAWSVAAGSDSVETDEVERGHPGGRTVGPRYAEDGSLIRPDGFERWVLAGSSLGLGYADAPDATGLGAFHNVYLEPGAYEAFRRTGEFPEGTMLAMAVYDPEERIPPQRRGYVEGALIGLEMAVKDSARFDEGWAYFAFATDPSSDGSGSGASSAAAAASDPARTAAAGGIASDARFAPSARAFPATACFACHNEHAARDNVFTQFYPLLREGGTQ